MDTSQFPSVVNFEEMFPDVRETGKTRIRQSQLVMLRMFKIFDYLCAKHDVQYFLIGGSLLGAIRHKGFIPWDDDLDVGMTRVEYHKFLILVVPELPKDIFFQNQDTDQFYPGCSYVEARLRDKYSSYNINKYKYHDGLLVDIFVFDKAFLPVSLLIIIQNKVLKLSRKSARRAKCLMWISRFIPFKMVYCSSYMQSYSHINAPTYIKEKEISHLIRVKFEDAHALIPAGWVTYLHRQYGDYMKMPPIHKRTTHHNKPPDPFTPCEHESTLIWKKQRCHE